MKPIPSYIAEQLELKPYILQPKSLPGFRRQSPICIQIRPMRRCFTQNQARARLDCNQALKDSNAQRLSQTYGGLPPAQQTQLAAMPLTWATLRMGWALSAEADRQNMRSQWLSSGQTAQAAAPGSPADQQAINAALERVAAQQAVQRYTVQQIILRNMRNPDGTRFSPVWLPHR